MKELAAKAQRLPFAANRDVILALWLKTPAPEGFAAHVATPRQVLDVLR